MSSPKKFEACRVFSRLTSNLTFQRISWPLDASDLNLCIFFSSKSDIVVWNIGHISRQEAYAASTDANSYFLPSRGYTLDVLGLFEICIINNITYNTDVCIYNNIFCRLAS